MGGFGNLATCSDHCVFRETLRLTHLLCVRDRKDDRVEQLQLLDVVLCEVTEHCLAASVVGVGDCAGGWRLLLFSVVVVVIVVVTCEWQWGDVELKQIR